MTSKEWDQMSVDEKLDWLRRRAERIDGTVAHNADAGNINHGRITRAIQTLEERIKKVADEVAELQTKKEDADA